MRRMAKGEGVHRMCQYKPAGTGSRLTENGWGVPITTHLVLSGVRRSQAEMRGCRSGVEGIRQEVDGMFEVVDTLAYIWQAVAV
jgi:hypothetical protein